MGILCPEGIPREILTPRTPRSPPTPRPTSPPPPPPPPRRSPCSPPSTGFFVPLLRPSSETQELLGGTSRCHARGY